jgi:hypothetical protein
MNPSVGMTQLGLGLVVLSSFMMMEEKLRLIPATMDARQAIIAHIVTTRQRSGLSVYCTLLE